MMLTRWTPGCATRSRNHEMDRFLNEFFQSFHGEGGDTTLSPSADVVETDDAFQISVELPGAGKDDIHVTMEDDILEISAEKKQEDEAKEDRYYRRERSYGAFSRRFKFGQAIAADKISATYKDGVLRVDVPKAEEAKPKAIEVKIG